MKPAVLNPILAFTSSLLGVASVACTAYMNGITTKEESPVAFFQWLFTVYVNLQFLPTILLLFIVGLAGGLVFPTKWLLIGVSTMSSFIIAALLEICWGVGSHNVWPIELLIYLFFTLFSLAGAGIGRLIMKD